MRAYIEPVNPYVSEAWAQALAPLDVSIVEGTDTDLWLLYQDYDSYDFETRDAKAQWVYSYVYRKAITRKNYLGSTIAQYRAKRPHSILYKAWPDSFNFELDFPEFLDDALDECWDLRQALNGETTWILKPALGERAHGIRLFRTQDELQQIFDEQLGDDEEEANEMRQYVVQQYITNPLLVDSCKFHLRVYCLCVEQLKVYVHPQVLALFSSVPFDVNNIVDMSSHLTNTCFQSEDARVELLNDVVPEWREVLQMVCDVVHDLFEAAQGNPINFQALPNAFEWFGLDFIVCDDLSVKLLEVNAYPDFKQTGPQLRPVVESLFRDTALVLAGKDTNLHQVL